MIANAKAALENANLSEPIQSLQDKLAGLVAPAAGTGAPAQAAALSNTAANSAATATQNIRIIISEAKEALANLVGFEMPQGVDFFFSQMAEFLGKALETFDGLYKRIDGPARRLRSLFPIITDMGKAIAALNQAMQSFRADVVLPDLTRWGENVRTLLAQVLGVTDEAERLYGKARLAGAAQTAGYLKALMEMSGGGGQGAGMAGGGRAASGGGGTKNYYITINAPGGDPKAIEQAVRRGTGGVLGAARAAGVA